MGPKRRQQQQDNSELCECVPPPNINVHLDEKNSKSSVKNNTRNNINSDKTIILELIYSNSLDYTMLA